MCGRYTLATIEEHLVQEFDVLQTDIIESRYNIAPTQSAPIVRMMDGDRRRQLDTMRWGLIPHWAKDSTIGNRMINARSESVDSKPSFRKPFRSQRCLIPCTGFYEWKKVEGGTPSRPKKQPYYIRRQDERVFAFAGLWDRWHGPEGEAIESYAILTTEPNDLLRPLHNRMPVIIAPNDYDLWLATNIQDVDSLKPLFQPYAGDEFAAYTVGTQVNNPANDHPSCMDPKE